MGNSASGGWKLWRLVMWGGAAVLLLLPAVAMQFTTEVNWDETDFIVIGAMLAIACGTVELAARASGDLAFRAAAAIAVAASFLLIWINLAVGIIGSEDNPANLMYGGVLGIAVVGSMLALGSAARLAWTMYSAASAQMAVALIALIAGWGSLEPPGAAGILILNGFFAGLWLLSGRLFQHSVRKQAGAAA